MFASISLSAQDSYYMEKAKGYMREAEYYSRNQKVDAILDKWFPEYTPYEIIKDVKWWRILIDPQILFPIFVGNLKL